MKNSTEKTSIFAESNFYVNQDDVLAMSYLSVKQEIKSTKGKFFSVEFVKADGTIRKMVCRLGVHIGVNGNGTPSSMNDMHLKVYDIQKQAWRSFRLDRLVSFKCGNKQLAN